MTTETENTAADARAEYVAGLRALADALEQNPDIRLPITHGLHFTARDRAEAAAVVALMSDPTEKTQGQYHRVDGHLRGVPIFVMATGAAVGGREVKRQVTTYEVPSLVSAAVQS